MAGNTSRPGATVTSRRAGAARRLRRATTAGSPSPSWPQRAGAAGAHRAPAGRRAGRLGRAGPRPRPGEYVVGRRLWDLGLLAPVQTGLRELASPFLHDLYGATLATVHLAVRDGAEVLYLDRLAGHASVPVVSTDRVPAAAARHRRRQGAAGPRARATCRRAVLARLTRITPYTITQPGTLRRQLARVLRDGYATTVEEMSLGACSVAVPVRRGDDVVAALGIVVPQPASRTGRGWSPRSRSPPAASGGC